MGQLEAENAYLFICLTAEVVQVTDLEVREELAIVVVAAVMISESVLQCRASVELQLGEQYEWVNCGS